MNHISYSELTKWAACPYYHKVCYVDKVKLFEGNEYTAFGTAIHDVCEALLKEEDLEHTPSQFFEKKFLYHLGELKNKNIVLKRDLTESMRTQGVNLSNLILDGIKEYFGKFDLVDTEHKLYEAIENFEDYNFKGYVDAIVQTEDGKYHIIDWKTCSWGWDSKKKNESLINYQLVLYKHYFAKKMNISPSDIETHFCLLKRTAKTNKVEFFRITSGPKKTKNCLKLLEKAIYNIKKENFIKNRTSCTKGFGCELYNTKYCT
jgi:hypothetical protein